MDKTHRILLDEAERAWLQSLIHTGTRSAQTQRRARILLLADENRPEGALRDAAIARAVDISSPTVERARREYCQRGRDALLRKARLVGPRPRKLDALKEAQLITLCCQQPPEGQARWSLSVLADKLVELQIVETICPETIRQTLHSNALKPWLKKHWCLPPQEQRRVRLRHGRGAGSLSPARRSPATAHLPG